jgi:hypothetical protein
MIAHLSESPSAQSEVAWPRPIVVPTSSPNGKPLRNVAWVQISAGSGDSAAPLCQCDALASTLVTVMSSESARPLGPSLAAGAIKGGASETASSDASRSKLSAFLQYRAESPWLLHPARPPTTRSRDSTGSIGSACARPVSALPKTSASHAMQMR